LGKHRRSNIKNKPFLISSFTRLQSKDVLEKEVPLEAFGGFFREEKMPEKA